MLIPTCRLPHIDKKNIRPVPVQGIAIAPALGGFYTFDGIVLNLLGLNPDSVYFLHQVSFVCDVDKNAFLNAIDSPITSALYTSMNRWPIFQGPLPVGAYDNVWTTESFFQSTRRPAGFGPNEYQEQLVVKFGGRLIQTAELIALGKPEVKLFLSLGLLEVVQKDAITEWGV